MRSRPFARATGLFFAVVGAATFLLHERGPTFSRDVAPLVYAKCAPCHRPGQAGPFSLLTYEDVKKHAAQIKKVTSQRIMPPWKPAHDGIEFLGDRSLTSDQIALFSRWVDAGSPVGDEKSIPPAPQWPSGWELGTPDLIVELPSPYELGAEGKDVYRNFVLRAPSEKTRYVVAWEFRPNTRAIHHAILNVDRLGLARRRDGEDGKPGWDGMDVGDVSSADGFYLVWAPGMHATPPDPARAWRIDSRTDLVLQLHMQPRGKAESVHPTIGLYLSNTPPTERLSSLRVGDGPIDIAPGDKHFVMRQDVTLPTDVDVISLFPHAHYLATTVKSWATLPDHSVRELLEIDAWDFNWQDAYTYRIPVHLPRDSTISVAFSYDNSEDNPHQPSHPPRRVESGPRTTDEMGNITFEVIATKPDGDAKLRVAKYTRLLAAEETAKNHYNLGNALAADGRAEEAIAHYRRATELDPSLAPAEFNLGNVLLEKKDVAGAIDHFKKALAAKPDHEDARLNLGHALEAAGQWQEAIAEYRALLAQDGRHVFAHASLGMALAHEGDTRGGVAELEEAKKLDPESPEIRAALERLAGPR